MESPWNPLYKKCCATLRQQRSLSENEIALCDWVGAEFDVPVPIFIAADKPHDKYRLWIVFFIDDEKEIFCNETDDFYGLDEDKEQAILKKARELTVLDDIEIFDWSTHLEKPKRWWQKRQKHTLTKERPDTDLASWFVIRTAFAPVALVEAVSKVPKRKLKALKREFSKFGIWRIERSLGCAYVMFYTEEKRLRAEENGVQKQILKSWKDIILPYDEFDILQHIEPRIHFDSKEVFDRDYNSSWMTYFR